MSHVSVLTGGLRINWQFVVHSAVDNLLTAANDILKYYFLFYLADNSHEMASLIFSENNGKEKIDCHLLQFCSFMWSLFSQAVRDKNDCFY